jgi:hypothetical protein
MYVIVAVRKLLYGIELWCKRNINIKQCKADETLECQGL